MTPAPSDGKEAHVPAADVDFVPPPKRDLIFSLLCIGLFCGQMGLSIIAPFFPMEAEMKGISSATTGCIFGIFQIAVFAFTPICVRAVARFGPKTVLVTGNLVGGVCNTLLGLCWFAPNGVPFSGLCLLLRFMAGLAASFTITPVFSMVPVLFGPRVSTANGIVEVLNGIAMICGPVVGSVLFELGGGEDGWGFVVPFMVLGAVEVSAAVCNLAMLPPLPAPSTQRPSMKNFSFGVVVPVSVCIISGVGLGILEPTLGPHVTAAPLSYSISKVGFVFACACGFYAAAAPLAGAWDDHTGGKWALLIMAVGCVLGSVGYALMAPITGELTDALVWTGAALIGIGCSFALIPVMKNISSYSRHETKEEKDLATAALLSMSMSFGMFLGPTAGGVLSELFGISLAYLVSSAILFMMAGLLFIKPFLMIVKRCLGLAATAAMVTP